MSADRLEPISRAGTPQGDGQEPALPGEAHGQLHRAYTDTALLCLFAVIASIALSLRGIGFSLLIVVAA